MSRRGILAAIVLFANLLLIPASTVTAAEKIQVLHNPGSSYTPLFVAIDQGYFAKRNLDITPTVIVNQGATLGTINSGGAQIGATTMMGLLQAAQSGVDLVIVAGTGVSMPNVTTISDVIVRNDGDIHSPKDLAGKTIAVPGLNEYFHVLTRRWLRQNGVEPSTVKFVEISLSQMGDALKASQIDAILTVEPFSTRVKSSFGRVLINFDSILPPETLASVYVSSRSWAESHKDVIHAYQDGLNEALDFIKQNPAAARTSAGTHLKLPPEAAATMAFPVFQVAVSPDQVQFWIDMAKDQQYLPVSTKLTAQSLIFH